MKQIVFVDEYQPSSATLTLNDPIYTKSQDTENIRIGVANYTSILILFGIAAVVLLFTPKK